MHAHTRTYTHSHIYMHLHTHVNLYAHAHVHAHNNTRTHAQCALHTHTHTQHTHTNTHKHTQTYTKTHKHTHKHTPFLRGASAGDRPGTGGIGRVQFDTAPSPALTPSWKSTSWSKAGGAAPKRGDVAERSPDLRPGELGRECPNSPVFENWQAVDAVLVCAKSCTKTRRRS